MTMSFEEWNKVAGAMKDISCELPDGFLMVYQKMRAKVVWKGKTYLASAWLPPKGKGYVVLTEVK